MWVGVDEVGSLPDLPTEAFINAQTSIEVFPVKISCQVSSISIIN